MLNYSKKGSDDVLPYELKKIIGDNKLTENKIGESEAKVYKIESEVENYYLKIKAIDKFYNLKREKEVYEFLNGKISVPKVLYYDKVDNIEYLLISEIKGNILSFESMNNHPKNVVEIMAKALRRLHNISIDNCRLSSTIEDMLNEAKYRVDNGLVDEEAFEENNKGRSAREILNYLLNNKPLNEDLVFIHGDYCFPNVIALNGEFNGLIDMDNGGIGDKYRDIALALRSIEHNFMDRKLWGYFMKYYGEDKIDMGKVSYHILLDELF